jgi:hypothetical protein
LHEENVSESGTRESRKSKPQTQIPRKSQIQIRLLSC